MKEENTLNKKMCEFYVSDYHFEMISLPYIIKNLESKRKVIILTENNLEKSIKTLVSKMILKEEKKNEILDLDWNKNEANKLEEIKNKINNEEMLIFIKGKEKYINKMNKKLEEILINSKDVETVDCYDVEGIEENMQSIVEKYKNILNTEGKKEIQKI